MLIDEIKKLQLQGDILNDPETLKKFSHDASLFEVQPELVIAPKNVEDIKKIVKFCAEQKIAQPGISITARSAGTDMSGGPLNNSIILDFTKYFNHVSEVEGSYITTEPGVYYRDFEKVTLKYGKIFPPYPASRELCAMGGIIANNSAGEKTLTYGKAEDYIEELNIVLSDGNEYLIKALSEQELQQKIAQNNFEGQFYKNIFELIQKNYAEIEAAKPKVSKNSAGYFLWNVWDKEKKIFNLVKLFVGSQGTLGIVTKAKIRLVDVQKHSKMLVVFMRDLAPLAQITNDVLAAKPESFESYDDKTLKLAFRFLPDLLKRMKNQNIFKLTWQFIPEAWMTLTGGFPKLVLMAEFTGNDMAKIDTAAQKAYDALKKYKIKQRLVSEAESEKYWTIRRESFNLLRNHIHGRRTAPFIDDIIVQPKYLPDFLPKLNKILDRYKQYMIYTIAGHVGNGNFHIIPLMDMRDPKSAKIIPEVSDQVYNLVLSYHGSITAEHNDGIIRSPYLEQMYGPAIFKLFEQTKKIFDPENIFNPGKKTGSSIKYAMSHLVRE